jgi:hypothetical protein
MVLSNGVWPEFEVAKLDAARRQLETAIYLLFEQADAISIHTLAHAAFGILKDVAEYRKADRVLQVADEIGASTFNKKGKRVFSNGFNKAGNFFKHGDKDPTGSLSGVPEEENEALISIAVEVYRDLGCLITPEIQSFYLWWRCINFQSIDDVSEPFIFWLNQNANNLHAENRSQLLNMGKELLRSIKEHGKFKK